MASSSSASSLRSWKYDVFLSFRGEDTRKTFVDHLYTALGQRCIRTYKDDITLPRGESVGPALLEAIEESHIAVIIFSKNYPNSSWCLDELVHIMRCRDENGQIVMPIFYDVDPSDVRKQEGEFGEAFAKQKAENVTKAESVMPVFYDVDPSDVRNQKRKFGEAFSKQEMKNVTKAELWQKALVDASNISGWEPKNVANGHEAAVIQKIVDAISEKLLLPNSDIDEELVGMTDRVEDLISRLEIGTGGVRMVGIWGVGGGGKTTLATSVYKKIKDHFQGHCNVDNIREESSKSGLKTLQAKLLKTVLKTEVEVQSEDEGKDMIKSRLCNSKVLILLDDVDDPKQLEALAESHSWFGPGSRIIITTRDEHVLRTRKVNHISPVTLLSQDEGIRLFRKHAYNKEEPLKDYGILSLRVVSYADGLPLALKVLGSFLYDKDEKEWMSTLDRLKEIPEDKIVKKLKISYDGLKKVEQELFLDIACFFRWINRNHSDAMEIFEACGFHPDIGIKVLIQKALITINSNDEFDMHDLVQEMAHYIVRGEHPNNPEKHSRVWKKKEIKNMCIEDATTENDKIEAAGYYRSPPDLVPSQLFKFVSNLKKLRWIHVRPYVTLANVEGPNFLSNELRYVDWQCYPASPFPDSFQPMNLVVLKLGNSFQKELWRSHKRLPQLKVLQLKSCKKLVSTPNFDGLPCLQKLELCDCYDLEEIHPSIGNHRSLESVKVSSCDNLRIFPTIFTMEKLKVLQLHQMEKLVSTPNFDGLPCLQKLELCFCHDLEEIHPSIGNHRSLKSVKVSRCSNLRMFPTIFKMDKLELLEISYCHESLEFPDIQANMESLVELCLYEIGIEGLMSSIGERCTSLISLCLYDCFIIKSIKINFDGLKHLKDFRICRDKQPWKMPLDLFTDVFPQLTHRLQRLDLSDCCLEDGEIPSAIGEMSNLQELNLSYNYFSKLDFSISRLTRLKLLNLSGCKRLLELPQLPSSIAILLANKCDSLTDVGDFYVDCKRLWYASLICSNMVINGNRFLQSMLEGATAENHCVTLHLPKGFTPCLRDGNECTLELPENWCSDFCGFLMFAVFESDLVYWLSPEITIHQVTGGLPGMDFEDDVVWKESDAEDDVVRKESDAEDDVVWKEITWVGYFPFASSLRDTEWWDSKYKKLSFSSYTDNHYPSKFGVRLVRRKGGSGPTETSEEISTHSSGISDGKYDYTPGFEIRGDSKDYLEILPREFPLDY